jgi:ABC-type Fe3+/spermidine/putrescine transport system ATPase subunit
MLEITQLCKRFGETIAVDHVSLAVSKGEIACLLGPSGCGKTTLLRLIAGLETADSGIIRFAGRELVNVPVHQRNFGFMFQDYALFPHKNVAKNVAFGLQMAKLERQTIDNRVREVLELVGLADMSGREINTLSGGEQQRVALARSLAPNPHLLLLDEPLGSLDRALRERLMNELRKILKQVGVTAITVTHDQQEAFALADKLVIMDTGRALQVGAPERVYRHPASPTVARFLGLTNLLEGQILPADPARVHTVLGAFRVGELGNQQISKSTDRQIGKSANRQMPHDFGSAGSPPGDSKGVGHSAIVLLHPEAASVCPTGETMPLEGTLTNCSFRGGHYQIKIAHPAGPRLTFTLRANPADLPAIGESICLHLDLNAISLLPNHA